MNYRRLFFAGLFVFLIGAIVWGECGAQEAQPDTMRLPHDWTVTLLNVPLGTTIGASEDADTQLEANAFIGVGPSMIFKRVNWPAGIIASIFFYNTFDSATFYPVGLLGLTLFRDKCLIGFMWDFGKKAEITGMSEIERRLKFGVSYNIAGD